MKTYTYAPRTTPYPLAVLLTTVRPDEVEKEYLAPHSIPQNEVKCVTLHTSGKKTTPKEMREFVSNELVHELQGAKYLVVGDAEYFKVLTGQDAAEKYLGYVLDCAYGPWKCVYVPSTRSVFYDPAKTREKISRSLGALLDHLQGKYRPPGDGVIHFEAYPQTDDEVADWLEKLLQMDRPLSCDTENFSLKHAKSGLGTITFCWSKHEGIAFPVDYHEQEWVDAKGTKHYGLQVRNEKRRVLLRSFFRRLMQKTIYHNISYDATILIAQLFMRHILDTEGLLEGLGIILRNWDCTQLITYLATNTCAGNDLKLKPNAQEFSGNYAVDELHDITLTPLKDLLRYNLVDGLSTWYLHEKNYPRMVEDQQLDIYENLFKPSLVDLVQAQLTGLPINMEQTKWAKKVLEAVESDALKRLNDSEAVQEFTYELRMEHVRKRNEKLKKKRISLDDLETLEVHFNPNSGPQLQWLLYEQLGFPVISYTESKLPSTDGETLEKLLNHTKVQKIKDFLQALIDYKAVVKILEFVEVFETESVQGLDGWWYLFGSFKLGGTLSGRLSSSNPNLQNLPSNVIMAVQRVILEMFPGLSKYLVDGMLHLGKLVKSCVSAPAGWLFSGLDFMSLEDRISALTTKDPNKLKVYTDGYDAHSMNAHAYFGDEMEGIDSTSVTSINSIKKKYPKFRQDSKAPTFALTYQGTHHTLQTNCGFSEAKAKLIEARYKKLYEASIAWVQAKLQQASRDGYITAAFGLRIRTPLLKQTIRGTKSTPYEAEAEGRSAGNALGQSWCLLTNRATLAFMRKVRASPYRLWVRPVAQIHDATYFLVLDRAEVVVWVNEHLREEVRWQEHPDIAHDQVKLDGAYSLFYPDWSNEIELPYKADEAAVRAAIIKKMEKTT